MQRLPAIVIACSILSACIQSKPEAPEMGLPSPRVTIVTSKPPTAIPSPTPTPSLAEWIYPYTIEGLRARTYLSGVVIIENDPLAETDVYKRYAIRYPSDGLTITGVMQVPKIGREPFPVILMNHGFFSRAIYASGDGTDRAAEFLNRHGYLTISSDYRSWGGSDLGPSLFYSGLVIDVVNLLEAVPSIPLADPERIGMWGHSMGGGVTLKVLTISTKVQAAVLYSTVSADDADIIGRWGPGCIGDVVSGERLYGCNSSDILPLDLPPGLIRSYQQVADDQELLRQVAAYSHLDKVVAPVQIHYGTEDGILLSGTPPEWSQKAYQGFLDAGKQAEIFAYEGESHSFIGDQWYAFMERSAHFFDKNVK
jgi:dipeptidyl aminopeptidase/acylaminoacyl peptidase